MKEITSIFHKRIWCYFAGYEEESVHFHGLNSTNNIFTMSNEAQWCGFTIFYVHQYFRYVYPYLHTLKEKDMEKHYLGDTE